MQKEYVEGFRSKHQKPFSMFFLCGSFAALVMYWVNTILIKNFDAGDSQEATFFHTYWVAFQVIIIPVYALITFLVFKQSKLNYGEIMVFQLYLFSFLFIAVAMIHLLKFIFPHLQTRYIELPLIIIYTLITNFSFFTQMKRWQVIICTIISIGICFFLSSYLQDLIVELFVKKHYSPITFINTQHRATAHTVLYLYALATYLNPTT